MSAPQFIEKYTSNLTKIQKQTTFKQFISQCKKLSGIQIIELISKHYDELYKIFQENFQTSIMFLFEYLAIQDCFIIIQSQNQVNQIKQDNSLIRLLNQISKQVNQIKSIEWFSKMYTRNASIQKVLVYLQQMSKNYHHKISQSYFSEFLADFVKASAFAIETYLKLKTQSPKFDVDYIQHGDKLVKFTPIWVKNCYVTLINTMRQPSDQKLKISILNGIYEIVGALIEIQRQGNVESSICDEILEACFIYCKKVISLQELNQIYLKELQKSSWNFPLEKIQVPQKYTSTQIKILKQSFPYLSFKFIQQANEMNIYSDSKLIKYLLVILNELAPFEYQFKQRANKLFLAKIKNTKITTCYQGRFPLSVLWFNLHHYKDKNNSECLDEINLIYEKELSNETIRKSLKILQELKVENLNNQISVFLNDKGYKKQ